MGGKERKKKMKSEREDRYLAIRSIPIRQYCRSLASYIHIYLRHFIYRKSRFQLVFLAVNFILSIHILSNILSIHLSLLLSTNLSFRSSLSFIFYDHPLYFSLLPFHFTLTSADRKRRHVLYNVNIFTYSTRFLLWDVIKFIK